VNESHPCSSRCSLFYNSNVFGSCFIHILYTGCAKIKKKNSGARRLTYVVVWVCSLHFCSQFPSNTFVSSCMTALCHNPEDVWNVCICKRYSPPKPRARPVISAACHCCDYPDFLEPPVSVTHCVLPVTSALATAKFGHREGGWQRLRPMHHINSYNKTK